VPASRYYELVIKEARLIVKKNGWKNRNLEFDPAGSHESEKRKVIQKMIAKDTVVRKQDERP